MSAVATEFSTWYVVAGLLLSGSFLDAVLVILFFLVTVVVPTPVAFWFIANKLEVPNNQWWRAVLYPFAYGFWYVVLRLALYMLLFTLSIYFPSFYENAPEISAKLTLPVLFFVLIWVVQRLYDFKNIKKALLLQSGFFGTMMLLNFVWN